MLAEAPERVAARRLRSWTIFCLFVSVSSRFCEGCPNTSFSSGRSLNFLLALLSGKNWKFFLFEFVAIGKASDDMTMSDGAALY